MPEYAVELKILATSNNVSFLNRRETLIAEDLDDIDQAIQHALDSFKRPPQDKTH